MPPSLYYTTTVVLPFTIVERGNQNRQGGPISATKLVPGRVNLVAILVPEEPSLGGGNNAVITVVHYIQHLTTSKDKGHNKLVLPTGSPGLRRRKQGPSCWPATLRLPSGRPRVSVVPATEPPLGSRGRRGSHTPGTHHYSHSHLPAWTTGGSDTEAHSDHTDWFMLCLQNIW